jgi:hypothetical protein
MDNQNEENGNKRDIHWSKWTAIGTMTMAICALGTSLWQGYTLQQHNKLSVRPYLEFEANFQRYDQGKISFEIQLNNNGLGPADVTDAVFFVDGKLLNSSHQVWTSVGVNVNLDCLGAGNIARFYKVDDKQMVISTLTPECRLSQTEYDKLINSLRIELTYQSLYGEIFQTAWGLKTQ